MALRRIGLSSSLYKHALLSHESATSRWIPVLHFSTNTDNSPVPASNVAQPGEKRTLKRWQLMTKAEFERGTYHENAEHRRHKGKAFPASTKLIPALLATPFINIDMRSLSYDTPQPILDRLKGHVSLVGLTFRDTGVPLLNTWSEPFLEKHPKANFLHLNFVEGLVVGLVKPLALRAMKRNIPLARHNSFFVAFGDTEEIREDLRISNRLTGYAFLVDRSGLIRWRGCGKADADEIALVLRCYDELVAEKPEKERPPARVFTYNGRR